MRTTVDFPDDLHRLVVSISRDLGQTLSATVSDLVRRGLRTTGSPDADPSHRFVNGFPVISIGRRTTTEDVRGLDDEP